MEKVKYLILGAGPAGITFANMLKKRGENSFLVLEKEAQAGGLCRSEMVDGSPLDIGGGHFLDVRRPEVTGFLFSLMPREEWALFDRDTCIHIKDTMISHPMEANIWQLGVDEQVDYLASIARAGCNSGRKMPDKFVDWITWKLGERIAEDYMLPYNQKMFADDLDTLGTYWLEKLPDVSFEETLRSCLTHKPYGKQPGHAQFYYPLKYGYGEVWLRMAEKIREQIHYQTDVADMDCNARIVTTAKGERYQAEKIITTIPWICFRSLKGMPEELTVSIRELKTSAVEIRYVPEQLDTKAQWIYEPDPAVPYHRILVRHNFCKGSRGYWMETRAERTPLFGTKDQGERFLNSFAYPLNTIRKPEIMKRLLAYGREKQIYGLGRWGEHCHYNSDLVVELAMKLAQQI